MIRFIDINAASALIRARGIETSLTELASYIVDDYCRWQAFDKSARTAHHSSNGVIELMPIGDDTLYGFKYVNGHPGNVEKNLSTIMAFGALAEVDTGRPVLLSEMTLLTALRTAATSSAVARALARKDSRSMAVIGNGAQSEFQIMGFKAMLGLKEIRLYDIDPKATDKLRANLSGTGLKVVACASAREAVKGADIVTTITADKTKAVILSNDMIEPGMHINAVGGDCPGKTELHPEVLKRGRVFVEYEPQTRAEGDIQQMPADFPVTELWQLFTRKAAGRSSATEVTIFDSVGFALADFSVLRYVNDLATRQNAGAFVDLIPALPDPKNLYSLLFAKA